MRKIITARVIASGNMSGCGYKCYRLSIKVKDVRELKLAHLQRLRVHLKGITFASKITASCDMSIWRINVPVQKAREAFLVPKSDVKVGLERI